MILDAGVLAIEALPTMTDSMLERILFETPVTAEAARQLWYRPDAITVYQLKSKDTPPPGVYVVPVKHLYLSVPLANGQPITKVSPRSATLVANAQKLMGTYAVFWNNDEDDKREIPMG